MILITSVIQRYYKKITIMIFYLYHHTYGCSKDLPCLNTCDMYIVGSWDNFKEHKLISHDVILKFGQIFVVDIDIPNGSYIYRFKGTTQLDNDDCVDIFFFDDTKKNDGKFNVIEICDSAYSKYLCYKCNNYNAEHKVKIKDDIDNEIKNLNMCSKCLLNTYVFEARTLILDDDFDDNLSICI